jgi:GGDEF domain-containing protein
MLRTPLTSLPNALSRRLVRSGFMLFLIFGNCWAAAQLASLPSAGIEIASIDVLPDAPIGLSLSQVLSGQAGIFVKSNGLQVQHSEWNRAFWLRIVLKRTAITPDQPEAALLSLQKSYLDTVRLFTPSDAQSTSWQTQLHGDFFPPDQWTHETTYPQFTLPSAATIAAMPRQQITLYMQLDHLAPVIISPQLSSTKQARRDDMTSYAIYGTLFGGILLASVLAACKGWLYRDPIYFWYSAYAATGLLACMSHSGLAQQLLWRVGGYWPSTAILFFLLLCCGFQLQFTSCIQDTSKQQRWQTWSRHLLAASCVVLAIGFTVFVAYWRSFYFMSLGLIALTMTFVTLMMIRPVRAGSQLAKAWLLATAPLWLTVVVALMEGVSVFPTTVWSFNAAIYAAGAEVLFVGFGLQWFARERHGLQERSKALATTDPLTGFATDKAFQQHLLRNWHALDAKKSDTAVVYIHLQTKANNSKHLEQLLLRSVRVLRSATSAHDLVARLDGQLMAIWMPNVQRGDDLSQHLSRIVALGLMPDFSDPQSTILQFRIAATTRRQYTQSVAQLDADLRARLAEPQGWSGKPIRYLEDAVSKRTEFLVQNSSDLEEFWQRALDQERRDSLSAHQASGIDEALTTGLFPR